MPTDRPNNFAEILRRHDGSDYFNAKVLQAAGRYASPQSAYDLMQEEPAWYAKLRDMLAALPARVSGDVLRDLAESTAHRVVDRDVVPGACGVDGALRVAGGGVQLANTICEADRDRVRTAEERRRIQQEIDQVRAELDRLEAGNRVGRVARVG